MNKSSLRREILYASKHRDIFVEYELGWRRLEINDGIADKVWNLNREKDIVFFVGNENSELRFLEGLPNASVWIWLYGDETFRPGLNFNVIKNPAVIGVIRPYPFFRSKFFNDYRMWLKYIITDTTLRNISIKSLLNYIRYILSSWIRILRSHTIGFMHIFFEKENVNFFPGYTNLFAQTFISKFAPGKEAISLLENTSNLVIEVQRLYDFSFVGQTGSPNRLRAIRVLEKHNSSLRKCIVLRDGFGGTEGSNGASLSTSNEYIDTLVNSRFSLCPSGNFAGASFRWFESLILGAIPIQSTRIPSDPCYESFVEYSFSAREPWSKLFNLAEQVSEEERLETYRKLMELLRVAVQGLNDRISFR